MIWCKYMTLECKNYCVRKKKGKANKFKMNNLYGSDLHYSTIQQHRKVWIYGSGCVLFMHVHFSHAGTCLVLAVSVCVLHLVSYYYEWIFNEAVASSTAVLSGTESVENSLSQPSVGISEGGLKSQAALPLPSIPIHSPLHGSESHSLTARPNCRWWKWHNTPCTVMLIPQLNYTPKQPGHC